MFQTSDVARLQDLERTLVSLLQHCTSMRRLKQIHGAVIRNKLHRNNLIIAKMLRFTAIFPSGDLQYARLLFNLMHYPNTFFWNTIIRGYAQSTTPAETISLFNQMKRNSIEPDGFTFPFLLKACSKKPRLTEGEELHAQILKSGFQSYLFVQNALLHLYAVNGILISSHRIFNQMAEPDVVSWSGLVVGYVKTHDLVAARRVFDEMPERDVVSWTAMIAGYAQAKQSKEALWLFQEMQVANVKPDEVTMVGVISACASSGDLEFGLSVHSYIDENGLGWMVSLCNALIDMYSKCGCVEGARQVFDKMERKSLITWNSMISAVAMHGNGADALGLFQKMMGTRTKPDGVTFLAILCGCAHKGWVEEGRRQFENMQRDYGIGAGIEHYGCMVDLLGRAGRLEEAYGLIESMPIQSNDVVWGALLGACRIHGDVDMGERVVKKLLELKPDEGGYYILLCSIYIAAGRRAEAIEVRREMKERGARKNPGCSWIGTG